jgi:hypothetical protein
VPAGVATCRRDRRCGERRAGDDAGADDELAAPGAWNLRVGSFGPDVGRREDFMTTTPDGTSLGDV